METTITFPKGIIVYWPSMDEDERFEMREYTRLFYSVYLAEKDARNNLIRALNPARLAFKSEPKTPHPLIIAYAMKEDLTLDVFGPNEPSNTGNSGRDGYYCIQHVLNNGYTWGDIPFFLESDGDDDEELILMNRPTVLEYRETIDPNIQETEILANASARKAKQDAIDAGTLLPRNHACPSSSYAIFAKARPDKAAASK